LGRGPPGPGPGGYSSGSAKVVYLGCKEVRNIRRGIPEINLFLIRGNIRIEH
jgi:hypothetical protein